jgi:hypothetical protein
VSQAPGAQWQQMRGKHSQGAATARCGQLRVRKTPASRPDPLRQENHKSTHHCCHSLCRRTEAFGCPKGKQPTAPGWRTSAGDTFPLEMRSWTPMRGTQPAFSSWCQFSRRLPCKASCGGQPCAPVPARCTRTHL